MTELEYLKLIDADAIEIISSKAIMRSVRGTKTNANRVIYRDRWGNEFRTTLFYGESQNA